MVTPPDVLPSFHQGLRNPMREIDDAAFKSAAEGGDLSRAVERLRFLSESFKWHADGEDELLFPAMDKVAPLVAQGHLYNHHEFDTMTKGLAKITAASDALVAARGTETLAAVLRIRLDKEDEYLYPILKERTTSDEQSAVVVGMAAHVPSGRNPEFIKWLFTNLGRDDREM